jgi:hypothetical protein
MINKYKKLILIVSSVTVITFLISEILYRGFIYYRLNSEINLKFSSNFSKTFSAYGVEPWLFDLKQGFTFNRKPWLTASFKDGKFTGCSIGGVGNRLGNVGKIDYGYEKADYKILIVGSSYSMVTNQDGMLVNELLIDKLSKLTKKNIFVFNYSRDATGILSNLDIANSVVSDLKPDLILVLANVTALIYQRHWRQVFPDNSGGRQFYMMLAPDANTLDSKIAFAQPQVINDLITNEWCKKMQDFKSDGKDELIASDMVVNKLNIQHEKRQAEVYKPKISLKTFTLPTKSFVWNLLRYKDPMWKLEKFSGKPVYTPLEIDDYKEDAGYINALEGLRKYGKEILFVHLPTYPEMKTKSGSNFAYGEHGVPVERGKKLAANIERDFDTKWVHLYDLYPSSKKDNPLLLVNSENDSHPSPLGVELMSEALTKLLLKHLKGIN